MLFCRFFGWPILVTCCFNWTLQSSIFPCFPQLPHKNRHSEFDCVHAANAFNTAWGLFLIALKRACAGPVGSRRPCSQLRSVPTSTCRSFANFGWLNPV